MAARDTQACRRTWSLAPQALSIAYGQAQFMSSTGATSPSGWFGPLTPLRPIAPPRGRRAADGFSVGLQHRLRGRAPMEPIGFEDLRALAETYDLLRLVIETRKDQVERMSWSLRPRRGATGRARAHKPSSRGFFERPDGQHCFCDLAAHVARRPVRHRRADALAPARAQRRSSSRCIRSTARRSSA